MTEYVTILVVDMAVSNDIEAPIPKTQMHQPEIQQNRHLKSNLVLIVSGSLVTNNSGRTRFKHCS